MARQLNVRLSKEVQEMLEVKAAVYARGNQSEFVRAAIEAYAAPLPPLRCGCGGTMEQQMKEEVKWPDATFSHVPVYVCSTCKRELFDEAVVKVLEAHADRGESFDFATVIATPATVK